jgi:S-adenosylmethionine:tRNA ribosyltransferase-isomerase
MGLRTDQLDFDFDPTLVAASPVEPRDAARLLVVTLPPVGEDDGRECGLEHLQVRDLPDLLEQGDRLVLNETRVVPARIACRRMDTGGLLDGLLAETVGVGRWWAMLRKSRRLQPGHELRVIGHQGQDTEFRLVVEDLDSEGRVLVGLKSDKDHLEPASDIDQNQVLALWQEAGLIPLPPYIRHARRDRGLPETDPHDPDWYQTTFAAIDDPTASVAAPTAGLHLTDGMRQQLATRGIEEIRVSLEVGAGTFKPVEVEELDAHPMHEERCLITPSAVLALRTGEEARHRGQGRFVAVGTTSVRTLESMPTLDRLPGLIEGRHQWRTNLLIQPGYEFRRVDAMLTNFHLPRSTLLALVAAMVGLDRMRHIYATAVAERYRFFSYGDAMFIRRSGS